MIRDVMIILMIAAVYWTQPRLLSTIIVYFKLDLGRASVVVAAKVHVVNCIFILPVLILFQFGYSLLPLIRHVCSKEEAVLRTATVYYNCQNEYVVVETVR